MCLLEVCCSEFRFCCLVLIFFFKQKTAYEMRISDWSSDVCSSDLIRASVEDSPAMTLNLPGRDRRQSAMSGSETRDARLTLSLSGTNLERAGDYNQRIVLQAIRLTDERSEERRVGKECGSTCRSRGSPNH